MGNYKKSDLDGVFKEYEENSPERELERIGEALCEAFIRLHLYASERAENDAERAIFHSLEKRVGQIHDDLHVLQVYKPISEEYDLISIV